ncbi:MAG TPA: DNA/RNA non-specific endonuclease [Pyrinomonadaceae bacterium]|nr:DNA/RNA non-specific endonuclease [Pyrinomonadaceae bacterium]
MKKFYAVFTSLFFITLCFFSFNAEAQNEQNLIWDTALVSPNIVISQIYGGGGNTGSPPYSHDFVELFNRGSEPVNLSGWSTQYASATGSEWLVTPLSDITLQPGQYYLIQYASGGNNGAALPTPDLIAPTVTNNAGNTFVPNLSATTGKLALVNSTVKLPASTCPSEPSIVDLVGFGSNASCFEGARTPDLSTTTAGKRNGDGCTDSDNNASDFTIIAPNPRNTSSPTNSCNLGSVLQASGAANPSTVAPGGNALLTVTVFPATAPASTGISVIGNLLNIGGAANQQFFDDGTNGDVTAGDNIFSYLAAVPANTGGGLTNVTAAISDAQGRTANVTINVTINAPPPDDNPLLLGNPSNATPDIANENNYLMFKPQYSLSYNRSRATANWVAWRLASSWLGTTDRQDDFRPDTDLPAGWYQVISADYTGSGYDRGHMVPSGDRTRSAVDNSATFLMTNIIPQHPDNNQGPWADFEVYLRTLATQGNEMYIVSGVLGNIGTIAQGKIVVPAATWKVVLVLPSGNNDLQRINKATRTIAIIVPNQPVNRNAGWRAFRTTVNGVEALTGLDFFSAVPKNTQELIERRRDRE